MIISQRETSNRFVFTFFDPAPSLTAEIQEWVEANGLPINPSKETYGEEEWRHMRRGFHHGASRFFTTTYVVFNKEPEDKKLSVLFKMFYT